MCSSGWHGKILNTTLNSELRELTNKVDCKNKIKTKKTKTKNKNKKMQKRKEKKIIGIVYANISVLMNCL